MKTINLIPDFELDLGGRKVPMTAKALVSQCLDSAPEGGFTVSTMRERQRVADVVDELEDGAGVLELEDQDAQTLLKCVQSMKWAIRHKSFIDFEDAIVEAVK
jgi:hypothetical protein